MIRHQFQNLYQEDEPPGDPIPFHISLAPIRDDIPDADNILIAVKRMQHGKSPGASGIHVSDILYWHHK